MSEVKNKGLGRVPVSRSFHERLLFFNNLDSLGFKEWIFHPAMLFGSPDKWWGDFGKRQRPHEGLDLYLYRTKEGNIHYLNGETKIPVIFEGKVVKVSDDFLGESVFIGHDACDSNGNRLYTIYGHIKPGNYIRSRKRLSEGDVVGVIADTGNSGMAIPHHLHVSVAWIPDTIPVSEMGWQTINDSAGVMLQDPLSVIECPHSIVSEF